MRCTDGQDYFKGSTWFSKPLSSHSTIVFWSLLASSSTFAAAYSAWFTFNTVFAIFEILCMNSPPGPWITLLFSIPFLALYFGVAYITHVTQGIYTDTPAYSLLNPTTQGATVAAYIFGILTGYTILFSLMKGVVVLRERWAVKNGHVLRIGDGAVEVKPSASIVDDYEEVESPVSLVRAKGDV